MAGVDHAVTIQRQRPVVGLAVIGIGIAAAGRDDGVDNVAVYFAPARRHLPPAAIAVGHDLPGKLSNLGAVGQRHLIIGPQ